MDKKKKLCLMVQEFQGILYYIDQEKKVYLTEDILESSPFPRVIGRVCHEQVELCGKETETIFLS